MKAAQILVGVAWLAATIGVSCTVQDRTLNLGFVVALVVAAAAMLCDWRARRAMPSRVLLQALGLGLLAFLAAALVQGLSARVCLGAARGCAAFMWFASLLVMGGERVKQTLVWSALALLVGNLAFALLSPWLPAHFGAFEIVQHEFVGGTPRFRGFANTPAPAGVWALASIGLVENLVKPRYRWLARTLGLIEACATLSIALLALPALVAGLLRPPGMRWVVVCAMAVSAAAILYFQPLELTIGGRTVVISHLQRNYGSEGFGPEYMPERTLALPGFTVRGHVTAYGRLAARGLTCFAEHPLFGVGPGRFREACRVMAMNTFGEWTDQRDSHNQAGGLSSELGSVGVALLVGAWLVVRRGYRFQSLSPWQRAVWIGLLVCAFGSEDLLTLPVLALLASQLEPRSRGSISPCAACPESMVKGNAS